MSPLNDDYKKIESLSHKALSLFTKILLAQKLHGKDKSIKVSQDDKSRYQDALGMIDDATKKVENLINYLLKYERGDVIVTKDMNVLTIKELEDNKSKIVANGKTISPDDINSVYTILFNCPTLCSFIINTCGTYAQCRYHNYADTVRAIENLR